jgi:transposase-like protein
MAGRPKRRARLAAEQGRGKPRAKRADAATRRRAVARAGQVGDAQAAEEFGLAGAPTIRSWRRRVKAEPPPDPSPAVHGATASETGAAGESEPETVPPVNVSRLDGMRRALAAAREVEAQAVEQTAVLLAAGNAGEARNAAAAGGIWSDKSLALEREIVKAEGEAEAERTRLQDDRLALWGELMRATFAAVDLPVPVAVMRELAARAVAGADLEVPPEIAAADRERVRGASRAEYLEELIAEGWAPPADDDEEELEPQVVLDAERAPAPEDEPEAEDEDERVRWSEPEVLANGSIVASHPVIRRGGVTEREGPGAGRRNRYDFRHPGLR